MSDISSVRKSVNGLSLRSACRRTFLPEGVLGTVLREEVIRSLMSKNPDFDSKELDQKVNEVFTKALKVFATLILMESDGLLKKFLDQQLYDNKLPFDEQDLAFLSQDLKTPITKWIDEFLHMQHIFLAPVFYKGAILSPMDSKYTLPFLENKSIAEGAFGVVYEIKIHSKHQCLQASQNREYKTGRFARKKFKLVRGHREGFEREKRILEQLLKLEHPNILPLLATYTYDNHFNMIFPLADMTLHDYLRIDSGHSGDYQFTMSLFRKVYGLIEALYYIHNFAYIENGKQLKLKGYHHDLKPKNILVQLQGEKFMIADFGLANLKNVDQPSNTLTRTGTGAYSPPEAKSKDVGRAYDIWSFGCILSEIVTFAIQGAKGVEGFAQCRTTKVTETVENDYFHDGENVKPEVSQHFQDLKSRAIDQSVLSSIIPSTLELVEQMLKPVDQRPTSIEVLRTFGKILGMPNHPSPVAPKLDTSEPLLHHPTGGLTASQPLLSALSSAAPSPSTPLLSTPPSPDSSYSSLSSSVSIPDLEMGPPTDNTAAEFQRKLTDLEDGDSNTVMCMAESVPVRNSWMTFLLLISLLLLFSLRVVVDRNGADHNEQ